MNVRKYCSWIVAVWFGVGSLLLCNSASSDLLKEYASREESWRTENYDYFDRILGCDSRSDYDVWNV